MQDAIISLITSLGYFGIALLMLAETVFPILPSELIMPFAGFTASRGPLNIILVILAGAAGSLLGAVILYLLGRHFRVETIERYVDRYGKITGLTGKDVHRSSKWFNSHAAAAVMVGRVVPGVRSVVSIPAGISRMPWGMFVFLSALGTILWTSALAMLGYVLGDAYKAVGHTISTISTLVVIGLLSSLIIYIIHKKQIRRR